MFRKARRVNVRKRNDSEEEERERDEEQDPPPLLLPPPGAGEDAPGPGGESLLGPGPPSALTPGAAAETGGASGFPGAAEPGNGLKPRKRPRENKEVPRASLLSFQDEEEGKPPRRGHPEDPPRHGGAHPSPPPAVRSGRGRVPALAPLALPRHLLSVSQCASGASQPRWVVLVDTGSCACWRVRETEHRVLFASSSSPVWVAAPTPRGCPALPCPGHP